MQQSFFQEQSQLQQQILSPQMLQSISLMTLSAAQLRERVFEELEKNPALEMLTDPLEMRSAAPKNTSTLPKMISGSMRESNAFQAFLENHSAHYETLQEHLLAQLVLLDISKEEEELAARLIQNLDEKGFNATPPECIFFEVNRIESREEQCELSVEQKKLLKNTLEIVRNIEPIGNACNNPQETLCWQASVCKNAPLLALDILRNHFDFLEKPRSLIIKKKFIELAKKNIDITIPELEEIETALDFIRTLEPYPARRFSAQETTYVLPDIIIRKKTKIEIDEGEDDDSPYAVIVSGEQLPVIAVSSLFKDLSKNARSKTDVKNAAENKKVYDFSKDAIKQAEWFMHSLEWRNHTLIKIARALVYFQKSFFEKGPAHLAPLRLKEVAEFMEVHEATVSRIANSKYIQCDWGFFEISHLFSSAVSTERGVLHSKESVKFELKQLIKDAEEKGQRLSDEKLSNLLVEKGIKIARRTVAKYRSELHIQSSFERF